MEKRDKRAKRHCRTIVRTYHYCTKCKDREDRKLICKRSLHFETEWYVNLTPYRNWCCITTGVGQKGVNSCNAG